MRTVTAFDLGALAGRASFEKTALGVTPPKAQMLNSTVGRALKAPAPAPAPNLDNPANRYHVERQLEQSGKAGLFSGQQEMERLQNPVNLHHANLAEQRPAGPNLSTPANQYHMGRQTGAFGGRGYAPQGAENQTANNYHMNLQQNPPASQYAGAANAYHINRQPGAFGPQPAETAVDQTANNYHANLAQRRSR
jgi:hypothetical protein